MEKIYLPLIKIEQQNKKNLISKKEDKMKIRNYHQSDKDSVISLWKEVFNPKQYHNTPELIIDMKIKNNDGLFYVAEQDNKIIGTVISGYDGHRGWIYSLAVHPKFRRKGIGTSLVNKALIKLEKLGCLKVNLQINRDNNNVIGFYEKNGFLTEERISMGKKIY